MTATTKSTILAIACIALVSLQIPAICEGLSLKETPSSARRQAVRSILGGGAAVVASTLLPPNSFATTDVDDFLRTGGVAMPMGVSGQAGKSKPITGVLLSDGTEIIRDTKSGNVLAEILVSQKGGKGEKMAVVTSFQSPWKLAVGSVYDVECRDSKTGDGAFLAVTPSLSGASLADVKDQFIIKSLFGPRGRFSFYGQPTDIKVKKSTLSGDGSYKVLDVSFSTLSQATQTEVPRRSRIVATVPKGSDQLVMLVGSSSATRWSKGSDKTVGAAVDSFRATAAPESNFKLRAVKKERNAFDAYE